MGCDHAVTDQDKRETKGKSSTIFIIARGRIGHIDRVPSQVKYLQRVDGRSHLSIPLLWVDFQSEERAKNYVRMVSLPIIVYSTVLLEVHRSESIRPAKGMQTGQIPSFRPFDLIGCQPGGESSFQTSQGQIDSLSQESFVQMLTEQTGQSSQPVYEPCLCYNKSSIQTMEQLRDGHSLPCQPLHAPAPSLHPRPVLLVLLLVLSIAGMLGWSWSARPRVTAVLVSEGDLFLIQKSLQSFYEHNTYSIGSLAVVVDGASREDLRANLRAHRKLELVFTEGPVGQVEILDYVAEMIEDQYLLYFNDRSHFLKAGFVEHALAKMEANPSLVQFVFQEAFGVQQNETLTILDDLTAGFTFKPSLMRVSQLKKIQGGVSNLTRSISLGRRPGIAQHIISEYLLGQGYSIAYSGSSFVNTTSAWSSLRELTYEKDMYESQVSTMSTYESNLCQVVVQHNKFEKRRYQLMISHRRNMGIRNHTRYGSSAQRVQREKIKSTLGDQSLQLGLDVTIDQLRILGVYDNLIANFSRTFHYDLIPNRAYNTKKPEPLPRFISKEHFKDQTPLQYMQDPLNWPQANPPPTPEAKLAQLLTRPQPNPRVHEAEFWLYEQKHSISSSKQELPLCVVVDGVNIAASGHYQKMADSIDSQNYSNYRVVYIDDDSNDDSIQDFKAYVNSNLHKVGNRLTSVIRNSEKLTKTGNLYLRARQLCPAQGIVVSLCTECELVGRQAFNLINHFYQQPEIWYVAFPYAEIDSQTGQTIDNQKNVITVNSSTIQNVAVELSKYLLTFRNLLNFRMPIEQLIEFRHEQEYDSYMPYFHQAQTGIFHIVTALELSGPHRVVVPDDILVRRHVLESGRACEAEYWQFQHAKVKTKMPLRQLASVQSVVLRDDAAAPQLLAKLIQKKKTWDDCIEKQHLEQNQNALNSSPVKETSLGMHLNRTLANLVYPSYYIDYQKALPYDELPFCLLLSQTGNYKQILQSIGEQHYGNIKVLLLSLAGKQSSISKSDSDIKIQYERAEVQSLGYYDISAALSQHCRPKSVIMFVNAPLAPAAITQLNHHHQVYNIWATFSQTDAFVQVNSFYMRVFELVGLNDFQHKNQKYLQGGDQAHFVLAILQLCRNNTYKITYGQLYQVEAQAIGQQWIRAARASQKLYSRQPYDYLLKLSQDFPENITEGEKNLENFHAGTLERHRTRFRSRISRAKYLKAMEYQQLLYLPDEHLLNKREQLEVMEQFGVGPYLEEPGLQLPLCVTVFGRNNTPNHRHLKNVQSILQQRYHNYRLVYVDDHSDDRTFEETYHHLNNSHLPKHRMKFVLNLRRKFATYNIINAGYNFCEEEEIQIRMDADDELIGKYAFQTINAAYQKEPHLWVVHSTFKSNLLTYGTGFRLVDEEAIQCDGRAIKKHYFSPLWSWRVRLLRQIPLQFHQTGPGEWLDTVSDDALQTALLYLAGSFRIRYLPHIAYEYNKNYGYNDDSSRHKIYYRQAIFHYLISLERPPQLASLEGLAENTQVRAALAGDEGKQYKVYTFQGTNLPGA